MPLISIDPAKKAAIDKKIALTELDKWFAAQVAEGFETEDGWKLGLSESDVTLLTGQFVLAKEASAADLPLPPVVDTEGMPHDLTMPELTALMLAYGSHRASLSAEYAARKTAIG